MLSFADTKPSIAGPAPVAGRDMLDGPSMATMNLRSALSYIEAVRNGKSVREIGASMLTTAIRSLVAAAEIKGLTPPRTDYVLRAGSPHLIESCLRDDIIPFLDKHRMALTGGKLANTLHGMMQAVAQLPLKGIAMAAFLGATILATGVSDLSAQAPAAPVASGSATATNMNGIIDFDMGSTALTASAKQAIQAIAADNDVYRVNVTVGTDRVGSGEANRRLADRRAGAIVAEFAKYNAHAVVSVDTVGENGCKAYGSDASCRAARLSYVKFAYTPAV